MKRIYVYKTSCPRKHMIHDEESQPLHPSTPLRIPRHIVANSVIVEEAVD